MRRPGSIAACLLVIAGISGSVADAVRAEPAFPRPAGALRTVGGVTPISQVNANGGIFGAGSSPLEFTFVTVEGVVQVGTGVLDPLDQGAPSSWYYISDGTGTVAIVVGGQVPVSLSPGQLVRVGSGLVITQGLTPIRGTRTIDASGAANVTVIGSGTPADPVAATANEINTNGAAFEGARVRLAGLRLVDVGEWPSAGASAFVRAFVGADTIPVYIDDETNLSGAVPPAAEFELIAFVAQDTPNPTGAPDGDHYLYPTSTADIQAGDGSGLATVTPTSVVEATSGLTLAFTLTGQDAPLGSMELEIPADWTWTNTSDVTLSGAGTGFASAVANVTPSGPSFKITVTNATVTSALSGTLTIGSLTSTGTVGASTFITRTATPGGTLTEIASSPAVSVLADAQPGDVVINEFYPATRLPGSAGDEEAEFIELYNRSATELDLVGWTLSDIGRTADCTFDPGWSFPLGTVLPPGGYLVVCRTAVDLTTSPPQGFLVDFPSLPPGALVYEMFDSEVSGGGSGDADDPSTPNLIPEVATPADEQIVLLGGHRTNVGQCPSANGIGVFLPFAEVLVLEDATGQVIDLVEYREPGPCGGDFCELLTGSDEAYAFGAPTVGYTLGRDASSTDTGVSRDDLSRAALPTPGAANVPGDPAPPTLADVPTALSGSVVEVRYDELVDDTALDESNYSVFSPALGESVAVSDVLFDPEEGGFVDTPQGQIQVGRHFYLVTEPIPAGTTASLTIAGVRDVGVGGAPGNPLNTTQSFPVDAEASTICQIQDFDEIGFSPLARDTVLIAGFVTVGGIPAVPDSVGAPTDRVSIWVQEPGGCGVNVFAFLSDDAEEYDALFPDIRAFGVRLNDLVQIRGRVTEFVSGTSGAGAVTEIAAIDGDRDFYRFLLRGLDGPEPIRVSTHDAGDERLEGTLIRTEGTVINSNALAAFIDDGSGSIQVFQNFGSIDLTRFTVGDRLDVTGIITQFDSSSPYFSGYELVPQNQDAIVLVGGNFAAGEPELSIVPNRVLVPSMGEKVTIVSISPARSDVILEIYDSTGRKITTLYDGIGLGELRIEWDGRRDTGSQVDPGIYVCHMRSVPLDGGSVTSNSAPIVVGVPLQ